MARDYASRAEWCLSEAETAFDKGNYPICVRRAQEALELATKAVLRYLGVEYPREHDVGEALQAVEDKLPNYLREMLPEMRKLLTELASMRGPAFYGYERELIPAGRAFGRDRAMEVLNKVQKTVKACMRFLEF
ncbi:MAG: HEPN domain-containing protein [Candidatus Caldarchaeum sp.]|nr:HEPN domain-containing protein [Candidatus Caldarchaeum sp.]MDW8360705.1 HEPN domain-containing protein [Candidatus Caldarchaeum sp.]